MDDFRVNYFNKQDADHFIEALKNITNFQSIGKVRIIADLHLTGTMNRVMWMSLCQDIPS